MLSYSHDEYTLTACSEELLYRWAQKIFEENIGKQNDNRPWGIRKLGEIKPFYSKRNKLL